MSSLVVDELIPAAAAAGPGDQRSTPFARASASRPTRSSALFEAADAARPARQAPRRAIVATRTAPRSPPSTRRLSADHLEHLDEAGAAAMAAAGMVAVLLPGAFYALQETRKPPVELLRDHGVPMAVATDCNPGTSPVLSPTLTMNMACTLFGLTPEEALAGMTINAARALGLRGRDRHHRPRQGRRPVRLADRTAWPSSATGSAFPGPERRIFGGVEDSLMLSECSMHADATTAAASAPDAAARSRPKSWATEAAVRMLMNNLDDEVAEDPQSLVVYGGIGRAARNWEMLRPDRRDAGAAGGRPDPAGPVGQAGRRLPHPRRRAARADRQFATSCPNGRTGSISTSSIARG